MILLTDGSVNTKLKIGFGAYLTFSKQTNDLSELQAQIKIKQFNDTSSTKLELQTLLWALSEINDKDIISYTDSQNIVGLLSRKDKLVKNNYYSKGGKLLKNHELYKEFFEVIDKINIQFNFISGHKPSKEKSQMDKIFSLVDKAARNAQRAHLKNNIKKNA